MPLKSDTVEAASRTLLLLEELNRHRVTSIDRLHKATGLPKSTVVRLMKSLCAMGYAANDRRQGGYAVASRVKSLSNGFHGDPLVVEAARPWALAFTRQYHWPIAIAVLDRSSVVIRFSTIPDSPVSPFHATLNTHLSLLGRALGRAYLAFCPVSERSMLLDMLGRSQESEDKLAVDRKRALALLAAIRKQGFAERDPMVEPRSSGTVALPITVNQRVLTNYMNTTVGIVTALNPVLGYDKATELANEAYKTNKGIIEIIREKKLLTEQQITDLLDPVKLTKLDKNAYSKKK